MLTVYDLDLKTLTIEKLEAIWDYLEPKDQEILEIKLAMETIEPIKKAPLPKMEKSAN